MDSIDIQDDNENKNEENSINDWSDTEPKNDKIPDNNEIPLESDEKENLQKDNNIIDDKTITEVQNNEQNENTDDLKLNTIEKSTKDDFQQTQDATEEQQGKQVETQENDKYLIQQENLEQNCDETTEKDGNHILDFKSTTIENSKNTLLRQSKSQDHVLKNNKLYKNTPKLVSKKKLKSVKKVYDKYNDNRPAFTITNNHLYPQKDVAYNPLTDQHLRGYFQNGKVKTQLKKMHLITKEGFIVQNSNDWMRTKGILDQIDNSRNVKYLNYDYNNMNIFSKCSEPAQSVKYQKRPIDLKQSAPIVTQDEHRRFMDEIRQNYLNEKEV